MLDTEVGPVFSVRHSPDGSTLASGGRGGSVSLWDLATSRVRSRLAGHRTTPYFDGVVRQNAMIWTVAFSPDGTLLASGADDMSIILWDVKSGRPVRTLAGHKHGVRSLAFTPDGKKLASGSADTTVRLWDIPSRAK